MGKQIVIPMTNEAPVRIEADLWPVIASGSHDDWDNEYEFQANRKWKVKIEVRKNADGRAIVYGSYEYRTSFQTERSIARRSGEVVKPHGNVVAAVRSVAADLSFGGESEIRIDEAERECIASLPPVDLDRPSAGVRELSKSEFAELTGLSAEEIDRLSES